MKTDHRKIRQGSWEPREGYKEGGHREPEEKGDRAVGEATEKSLRRAGRNECPMSDQVLKQPLPLEEEGTRGQNRGQKTQEAKKVQ